MKRVALLTALSAWALVGAPHFSDAGPLEGSWTLDARRGDPVHLNVRRTWSQAGSHGLWNWSDDCSRRDLRGSPSDRNYRGSVNLSLTRDAGTMRLNGRLDRGRGQGRFSFEPDPAFAADLKAAGYGEATGEDLLRLFSENLGRSWIKEAASLGLSDVSIAGLMRLRDNDVKPEYIREMANAGYGGLGLDELIQLRMNDVTPDYVKELGGRPGGRWPVKQVVHFRLNGLEPSFVKALAADYGPEGIVRLYQNGVSAEYVRDFRSLGYESASVDDLVRLSQNDVSPAFARRARELHGPVTPEELIRLRLNGAE